MSGLFPHFRILCYWYSNGAANGAQGRPTRINGTVRAGVCMVAGLNSWQKEVGRNNAHSGRFSLTVKFQS